jgi:hypothetical protein
MRLPVDGLYRNIIATLVLALQLVVKNFIRESGYWQLFNSGALKVESIIYNSK